MSTGQMLRSHSSAMIPPALRQHGRQIDVRHDGRWVEVWECGLAHPDVLAGAELADRSGLALGMGLDRMLMLSRATTPSDQRAD